GPEFNNDTIALGSALGCLNQSTQAFDLARSLKQRQSLWELFPWADAAVQIFVVVCLAMFLMNHSQELNTKYAAIRSETDGRHWLAKMSEQQLAKERTDLEQRVDAIRKFLSTRVVWTAYTHDIPERLPENSKLNSFYGICEMEKKGRKDDKSLKPKKS